jgi:hypothetical protein
MSYYAENPWERDEAPRCATCDQCMTDQQGLLGAWWECRNPYCDECAPMYQEKDPYAEWEYASRHITEDGGLFS